MASKGYATAEDVAAYMGVTFSVAQEALCELAIEAAEQWIDNETRHAWLETGPITETVVQPTGLYLRLSKPPIISVDAVSITSWPGATAQAITEDCGGWFVTNTRDGHLVVPFAHLSYSVTIEYTPNDDDVPADVHLAAVALAASNMRLMPTLTDGVDPTVVQRYVVGGELEVEYRKNLIAGGVVPQTVLTYLSRWLKGYSIV